MVWLVMRKALIGQYGKQNGVEMHALWSAGTRKGVVGEKNAVYLWEVFTDIYCGRHLRYRGYEFLWCSQYSEIGWDEWRESCTSDIVSMFDQGYIFMKEEKYLKNIFCSNCVAYLFVECLSFMMAWLLHVKLQLIANIPRINMNLLLEINLVKLLMFVQR